MLRHLGALIVSLAATAALGLPLADDTPASAEKKQPAEAEVAADKDEIPIEERLPPGFKVKKRGKFTLYCKTDTPLGTRDALQVRDVLRRAEHARLHARPAGKQGRHRPDPKHLLEPLRLRRPRSAETTMYGSGGMAKVLSLGRHHARGAAGACPGTRESPTPRRPRKPPADKIEERRNPCGQARDEEFKPPPGFKTKKRGEIVLYCMKDSTVGTRFKTEKCYDEVQMREYLLAPRDAEARHRPYPQHLQQRGCLCAPVAGR